MARSELNRPEGVHHWVSHNPCNRTDLDSPDDIEALAERTGLRLRWPDDLAGPT